MDVLSEIQKLSKSQKSPESPKTSSRQTLSQLYVLALEISGMSTRNEDTEQNKKLYELSKKITNGAYYEIRNHSITTPLGFITDSSGLAALQKSQKLELHREEAKALNTVFEEYGLAERMFLNFYPVPFRPDQVPGMGDRLVQWAQEVLGDLHAALLAGDANRFKAIWINSKNLSMVADGPARSHLQTVMDWAQLQAQELKRLLKSGMGEKTAGKRLDLDRIKKAISSFES